MQLTPPKSKPTTEFVQPTPPQVKQTSPFVQPVPPRSKQSSSTVQPAPPQVSPFIQPAPPKSKQNSLLVQPASTQTKQSSSFVQPAPPKPTQTSEFAQSQNSLIPKTVNQKPKAKPPTPVIPPPRKIVDYKDLDSVAAVPSGLTHLDYGDPATTSQRGSAKKPERPRWEASILQLQKLKEAAELDGDKVMAEKARKMINIFKADAASPGTETKAQVDHFKRVWSSL